MMCICFVLIKNHIPEEVINTFKSNLHVENTINRFVVQWLVDFEYDNNEKYSSIKNKAKDIQRLKISLH